MFYYFLSRIWGLLDLWCLCRVRRTFMKESDYEQRLLKKIVDLGIVAVKMAQYYAAFHPLSDTVEVRVGRHLQTQHPPVPGNNNPIANLSAPAIRFLEENNICWDSIELLAAGSVGSVHRARFVDEENDTNTKTVVLKIQYRHVHQQFQQDIAFLEWLSRFRFGFGAAHRHKEEIREILQILETQFDFTIEARNMRRYQNMYATQQKYIQIPDVYYADPTTLIMEYKPTYKPTFKSSTTTSNRLTLFRAVLLKGWVLDQIMVRKVFHGDLHPGNWGFQSDHSLVVYDLGYVYECASVEMRDYHGLLDSDPEVVCKTILGIFKLTPDQLNTDQTKTLCEIIEETRKGENDHSVGIKLMNFLASARLIPLHRRLLFLLNLVMMMRTIHAENPMLRHPVVGPKILCGVFREKKMFPELLECLEERSKSVQE